MKFNQIVFFFLTIGLFCTSHLSSQVSSDSELFIQAKKLDRIVFEEGFNKCNLEALEKLLSEDFEFYHDKGGIQNKEEFFKAMQDNICSSPNFKPIRKLVAGSLKVFPLKNNGKLYGAIQEGIHEFYIKEPGKELYITNIARFTTVMLLDNGEWKYSRVLSYDHQDPR